MDMVPEQGAVRSEEAGAELKVLAFAGEKKHLCRWREVECRVQQTPDEAFGKGEGGRR